MKVLLQTTLGILFFHIWFLPALGFPLHDMADIQEGLYRIAYVTEAKNGTATAPQYLGVNRKALSGATHYQFTPVTGSWTEIANDACTTFLVTRSESTKEYFVRMACNPEAPDNKNDIWMDDCMDVELCFSLRGTATHYQPLHWVFYLPTGTLDKVKIFVLVKHFGPNGVDFDVVIDKYWTARTGGTFSFQLLRLTNIPLGTWDISCQVVDTPLFECTRLPYEPLDKPAFTVLRNVLCDTKRVTNINKERKQKSSRNYLNPIEIYGGSTPPAEEGSNCAKGSNLGVKASWIPGSEVQFRFGYTRVGLLQIDWAEIKKITAWESIRGSASSTFDEAPPRAPNFPFFERSMNGGSKSGDMFNDTSGLKIAYETAGLALGAIIQLNSGAPVSF
ncbi:hypothetical protein C8R43DRAFT_955637 [Mycena crocata]|nr:hypothetical protein C8R43DRAFT_955637 [Mycena crocata]